MSSSSCSLFPLLSSDKWILIHSGVCAGVAGALTSQTRTLWTLVMARYKENGCRSDCMNVWSRALLPSFFGSSSCSIQTGLIDGLICGTNANRGTSSTSNCLLGDGGTEEEGVEQSPREAIPGTRRGSVRGWASTSIQRENSLNARNETTSRSSAAAFSDD